MDARWKLVAVLAALVMIPWMNTFPTAGVAFLLSLILLVTARVPITWWRDRLLGVGFFLLLFVMVLPFTVGEPTWTWWGMSFRQRGAVLGLTILLKSMTAVGLTLFLIGTTSMETLLHAATRLGAPRPILRVLMITWRYVRIMYESIDRFRIALRLRGFRNRVSWRTYQAIAGVVGTLLVHGFDHTERVSQAMRCRGYHGRVETLQVFQSTWRDIGLFGLTIASFGILLALAYCP